MPSTLERVGLAALLGGALELVLEAFDASGCVHKALFAGISRVAIGGNVANNNVVLDPVDLLGLLALHGRAGQKLLAGGYVNKTHRMGFRMAFGFHICKNSRG